MQYNINNFYLSGDNIIINGWSTTERHQHLTGNDTHEYSLVLTNKNTNESMVYIATLKKADKTRLMRATEWTTVCKDNFSTKKCYYNYTYVGFEFKIPVTDLLPDTEYGIKLRIYEKQVKKGYQTSIYALGIDNVYEKDGIKYQLYSDITKTNVTLTSDVLFVRSGPGQSYAKSECNFSCSDASGKTLYWKAYGKFTNIAGAQQTAPGEIDSELWVQLKYDYGSCSAGKARAVNGTKYKGWAPWVYMLGGGEPAIIKTTSLDTLVIDELRAYTAEQNTNTKAILTLTSSINQDITIKAYHNDALVYTSNQTINGTKSFTINYKIPNNGTLKVDVISKSRTGTISSNIYVSSKASYDFSSSDEPKSIIVDTPILVVTNRDRQVTEYREQIKFSVTPNVVNISQGRGLTGVESAIYYYYPLDEFQLADNYDIYALYPNQEDTQNYDLLNGKVKVDLVKNSTQRKDGYDISYFAPPENLLSNKKGNLYNEVDNKSDYSKGGAIWYPSWTETLGKHYYEYIGENIGINKITITKQLSYNITTPMFGKNNGKFIIKRVKNPNSSNVVYKHKFTYEELLEFIEGGE